MLSPTPLSLGICCPFSISPSFLTTCKKESVQQEGSSRASPWMGDWKPLGRDGGKERGMEGCPETGEPENQPMFFSCRWKTQELCSQDDDRTMKAGIWGNGGKFPALNGSLKQGTKTKRYPFCTWLEIAQDTDQLAPCNTMSVWKVEKQYMP